ncbi:MAG: hypothetical protein RL033_5557 [Pseudomonadota bacterium]|jgi:cysteine synthase B
MTVSTPALQMSRPSPTSPWVIWGGALPSGSLKYLTFDRYLALVGRDAIARGLIEISEGCTALALQHLAEREGVPLVVLSSGPGAARLRERGFHSTLQVPGSFAEALASCKAKREEGWHWPAQMSNPKLVSAVAEWASELAQLLRNTPEIETVVCGFGTGATLAGLDQVLTPLGYEVIGLQSAPGASIPGWRNYGEHNLRSEDLFHPHVQRIELRTAADPALAGKTPLQVLLAQDWGSEPARVCVVSHDGVSGEE